MPKTFARNLSRIVLVSALVIGSMSVVGSQTASAHASVNSASCSPNDWGTVAGNGTNYSVYDPWTSQYYTYTLYVYLIGGYNAGVACGYMYAESVLYVPAHAPSGTFKSFLYDCTSTLKARAVSSFPSGGQSGHWSSSSTVIVGEYCGKAGGGFYVDSAPSTWYGNLYTNNAWNIVER